MLGPMALRKIFSARFLHHGKHSYTRAGSAITPPPNERHGLRRLLPSATAGAANRRILLQQRSIFQSGSSEATLPPSVRLPLPLGNNLMERIRSSMLRENRRDITPSPARPESALKEEDRESSRMIISMADARKLIKASRIEAARARLRTIPSSHINYVEFSEICREAAGSDESAREISAALDQSGTVVVLADIVFLRPEKVALAIENAMNLKPIKEQQRTELTNMEARKAEIDRKAKGQVRRELWAGLGLLFIQTVGFMRLTFWELSWDVMEPICFFTTSIYFMLGYVFFLRTSKEPSFEGFFAGRFASKQRRLMELHGFDLLKYEKLRKSIGMDSHDCDNSFPQLTSCDCHCHRHRLDSAPSSLFQCQSDYSVKALKLVE